MKVISIFDLHRKTQDVVARLRRGEPMTLTYRGQSLANLVPIASKEEIRSDDPFYRFHEHADSQLGPLTNEEIDRTIRLEWADNR